MDPESSKEILSEIKAVTPEIYKDIAKPAAQEVGNVAGRTVKALLSPIRGMLWGWEKIEEMIEESIQKRLENIPNQHRKTPEPEIAVPAIEALRYTAQNETLREMYLNLIGNSMDDRKSKVVHPSFVELIKQMNSLDAKLFDKISNTTGFQKILSPALQIKGTNKYHPGALPEWYVGWIIQGNTEFDVSSSFIRLSKFGLIELMYDRTAGKDGYDQLRNSEYLTKRVQLFNTQNQNSDLEIGGRDSIFLVNEYGRQFKAACK